MSNCKNCYYYGSDKCKQCENNFLFIDKATLEDEIEVVEFFREFAKTEEGKKQLNNIFKDFRNGGK